MIAQELLAVGSRMLPVSRLVTTFLMLVTIGVAAGAVIGQDVDPDVQAMIESAMSAAPPAISAEATIPAPDGTVLREGTNGWTCFPDYPGSPGPDPACFDEVWMELNAAWSPDAEPPTITRIGFGYMLQGGSDSSNTDPFAAEPAEGEDWITTPPHVMILFPTGTDLSMFSTDHEYGGPYVMVAGTPYQHIMMPIAVGDHENMD